MLGTRFRQWVLTCCLLLFAAPLFTVSGDTSESEIEMIGLLSTPNLGVSAVESWMLHTEMIVLAGVFCQDKYFNFTYAATDVVAVFQYQTNPKTGKNSLAMTLNASLGNRYATGCFFKSASELYFSTAPYTKEKRPGADLDIVFAVFSRLSGNLLRFENVTLNPILSKKGGSSSSHDVGDNHPDKSQRLSEPYNYIGRPVGGAGSNNLCLIPYLYGQYVSVHYDNSTLGNSELQASSARTPFHVIRQFYKRPQNTTNLYIMGFYSLNTSTVDTFDIIIVSDDNIPRDTPDEPIATGPTSGPVVSDIATYYSFASVYRDALDHACPSCTPVIFAATQDGTGVLLILTDPSDDKTKMVFLPLKETKPSQEEEEEEAEENETGNEAGGNANGNDTGVDPLMVEVIADEVCPVTTLEEDHILNHLYATFSCDDNRTFIVRVRREGMKLTRSATYTLSNWGDVKPKYAVDSIVDLTTRTINYLVPCGANLCICEIAMFGSDSTVYYVDAHRLAPLRISGYGFVDGMSCLFNGGNTTVEANVLSTVALSCVVPLVNENNCKLHEFKLRIDHKQSFSGKDLIAGSVRFMQYVTPRVLSVVNSETGKAWGHLNSATLRVLGFGFQNSSFAPYQTCRLVSGNDENSAVYMESVYVSLYEIECTLPTLSAPLPSPSYIEVALDNVTFSYVRAEYTTYGAPVDIYSYRKEKNSTDSATIVTASSTTDLPTVAVTLVDEVGHHLGELDDTSFTGIQVTASIAKIETNQTFVTNTTLQGDTSHYMSSEALVVFDTLRFTCPPQGRIGVFFTVTQGGERWKSLEGRKCFFLVSVVEGKPTHLEFIVSPSTQVTPLVSLLGTQPIVGICDECHNVLRSIAVGQIPGINVRIQDLAEEDVFIRVVDNLQPYNNLFYVTNASVKGRHGSQYRLQFSIPALPAFSTLYSEPITVVDCNANELAVLWNNSCVPCPQHGVCDGSSEVLAEEGWWRTSNASFTFVRCFPPYGSQACLGNGQCAEGYHGVRCQECSFAYYKVGNRCEKCPSVAASNFLSFLVCFCAALALGIWVFAMSICSPTSTYLFSAKSIINVIQMMSLFAFVRIPWPVPLFYFFDGLNNTTNVLNYVISCSYRIHEGYLVVLLAFTVVLVLFSTLFARSMVLFTKKGHVNTVAMAAMLMVAYTHRRRRKMAEILDRIKHSYVRRREEDTRETLSETVFTSNRLALRSSRFFSELAQTNASVVDGSRILPHGPSAKPLISATVESETPTRFEDFLIECFERSTGVKESEEMMFQLARQKPEMLRTVSHMVFVLPTREIMLDWLRTSKQNQSPALGRKGWAMSSEEILRRKYIKSEVHDLPLRVGHGIEESYRYEAVCQYRKSWVGILMSSIAAVSFVLHLVYVSVGLLWQICDTIEEPNGDVLTYSFYQSSLLCSDAHYKSGRSVGLLLLILYGIFLPVGLGITSYFYRKKYGTDVMYAVFPVLYFNTRENFLWPEFYNYFEKFLCCVGVIVPRSPLMQLTCVILIFLFRLVFSTRYEVSVG